MSVVVESAQHPPVLRADAEAEQGRHSPSQPAQGTSTSAAQPTVPTATIPAADTGVSKAQQPVLPSPQPSSLSSSSTLAPLYSPPPSTALPSSSPFLPQSVIAPPNTTITIEGPDRRRHTYNDQGVELGNDPLTGCYEEVELEDMEWEPEQRRWTYPCPCGDRFVITVDDMQDGENIARCPSCSLVIRVIYDPEDLFEKEPDSDDER